MDIYFINKKNNTFTMGNSLLERTWAYDGQSLYNISLIDKTTGYEYINDVAPENCFGYEGLTYNNKVVNDNPYRFELKSVETFDNPKDIYSSANKEIRFILEDTFHGVSIVYYAILYKDTAAIRTFCRVKTLNDPYGESLFDKRYNKLDTLYIKYKNYTTKIHDFITRTDRRMELTDIKDAQDGLMPGNVITAFSEIKKQGFFIIKEGPAYMDERPETHGSFDFDESKISVLGWGIMPVEMRKDCFLKTYSSVSGVFNQNNSNGYIRIQQYLKSRFSQGDNRKYYTMINPWGDRKFYENVSEKFILDELEAASRLGAEQYQIDDGWQKGGQLIRLVRNEAIDFEDFWSIDPEKFPYGFKTIVQFAKEKNVELCLWFAPDKNVSYSNVGRTVDLLFNIYKTYNIKVFKLDAFQNRSKESETNFEEIMRILREKSNGEITFNLDVTANARGGYFMFCEYGGIFLENRYTMFKSYYPHSTLRNLWNLTFTVPAQFLQIEYLNPLLNKDKYIGEEDIAPWAYSYDYLFAVTMFANPLGWFESSGLQEEVLSVYRNMLNIHKEIRPKIDKGVILPVGDMPTGYSWTGFQCVNENEGYLLIFRENNESDHCRLTLHNISGNSNLEFKYVGGDKNAGYKYETGSLNVHLINKKSFILLHYSELLL